MKPEELMIGDWYYWEAEGKKYNFQVTKETFSSPDYDIYNFQPIPLTPEILEKNGWYHGKFDGSYGRKAMRLDGLHKDKLPDGVDNALSFAQWSIDEKFEYHLLDVYLWKGSVHLWIEYVHELQHVFKLCGIDKEIVL